jgi:hypothetical protein
MIFKNPCSIERKKGGAPLFPDQAYTTQLPYSCSPIQLPDTKTTLILRSFPPIALPALKRPVYTSRFLAR